MKREIFSFREKKNILISILEIIITQEREVKWNECSWNSRTTFGYFFFLKETILLWKNWLSVEILLNFYCQFNQLLIVHLLEFLNRKKSFLKFKNF